MTSSLYNAPFTLLAGPDVLEGDGSINCQTAHQMKAVVDKLNTEFNVDYYFKSSYDKANRTSVDAYRGPGIELGLTMLQHIKDETGLKIITDVHTVDEAKQAAKVADMIQIPAFLSRQTDLLLAAGDTGAVINLKKGQFLSPHDVIHAAEKIKSTGNDKIFITERGNSFGYNNLVVDMRFFPIVNEYQYPTIFDATHSIQLPGGQGTSSGGQREYAINLAKAAVAAGAHGLFFETHPTPDTALCDGPNMLPTDWMVDLLHTCLSIHAINQNAVNPLTKDYSAQPV